MNINELLSIKTINVSNILDNVKVGSGTFKNILDKVYDGTIVLATDNSGNIIGGYYDSKLSGMADSIEQLKFEKMYSGRPLMEWVTGAAKLKVANAVIKDVCEDGDDVYVITNVGKVVISESYDDYDDYDDEDEDEYYDDEDEDDEYGDLPSHVEIEYLDNTPVNLASVRLYLKQHYGYCLAKGHQPTIEVKNGVIKVSDIKWGRKLSQSEMDEIL